MHNFGEVFEEQNCNSLCDNCRHPKEKSEGKEYMQMLLKSLVDLQEMQKYKHYCSYLVGSVTADIKSYKHDQLPGIM